MKQNKKFISTISGRTYFLDILCGGILGWFFHIILSRVLGPQGYGQYSLISGIVVIFCSIFTPGIGLAVLRQCSIAIDHKKTLFVGLKIEFFIDTILYVVYYSILNFLCELLSIQPLKKYIFVFGIAIMPRGLVSIIREYLRGRVDFKSYFCVGLIQNISRLLFCIIFIMLGLGLWGIIAGLIFSDLVSLVFGFMIAQINKIQRNLNLTEVLKLSLPFWLTDISVSLMRRTDVMFIQALLKDYKQVGLYSAASRLSESVSVFLSITYIALFPLLTVAMNNGNLINAQKLLERSLRYCFILAVPLCIWLGLNSEMVMTLIFSKEFISGSTVFALLVFSRVHITLLRIINQVNFALGNIWIILKFNLIGIIFNILLNILLIPKLGIIGLAIATIISMTIVYSMLFYYAYKFNILPMKKIMWLDKRTIINIFLATSILILLNYFIHFPKTSLFFLFKTIIFGLLFFVLLKIFKEIKEEDNNVIKVLLNINAIPKC